MASTSHPIFMYLNYLHDLDKSMMLNIFYVGTALLAINIFINSKKHGPLPPGPKGYPVFGNLLDIPAKNPWMTFAKWGELYGDICSVTAFGTPMIIINSHKVAVDLLDKRSLIYSDRPVFPMAGELIGWGTSLLLSPYGDQFRGYRKMFHKLLGSQSSAQKFLPIQEAEVGRFLQRLLETPEKFVDHIKHTSTAVILKIAYGYQVKNEGDPFIHIVEEAMEGLTQSMTPGGFLVNLIPPLRYVPEWVPGSTFKQKAKTWKGDLITMLNTPFDWVQQQKDVGTAEHSFLSMLLDQATSSKEIKSIKWAAGSLYSAGADTTFSTIQAFFREMAMNPDIQARAQAEIDEVVGNDRLPSYADRDRLPYVNAVVKEVIRCHSVAPTNVPHRLMQDNIYEGYHIPKGSIILTNLWQLSRDPAVYPNPIVFNPNRFLPSKEKEPELNPMDFAFGYGRRRCPGMLLADASIFISCVMTLAVFNISKTVENGKVVEPVRGQTNGLVSFPLPFTCSIKPRSEKAVVLIGDDH